MGSVSTHHGTELSLALDELGVTGGYNKVVRKAAGGTTDHDAGQAKITWFILESLREHDKGFRYIAMALTSRGASYGVWCKVIDESCGPAYHDVPDAIWNNRPPLADSLTSYARDWRDRVAEERLQWPLALDKIEPGQRVKVRDHGGLFVRQHATYKGAPVFCSTDTPHSRTYFAHWKSLRAVTA